MSKRLTNRQRREVIGLVATVRKEPVPVQQHHRNKYKSAKADVVGRNNKHKGRDAD